MNVSVELPGGWFDRTVLTYVGPDNGSGSPSLVVSRDELGDGVSLARYAAMQDGALRAGVDGVELVENKETTLGGHPAIRHTYRWSYGERTMRQRVWCIVNGNVGHSIVASASEEEFEALRPVWARALASFTVED
jgi:hypothetical protein